MAFLKKIPNWSLLLKEEEPGCVGCATQRVGASLNDPLLLIKLLVSRVDDS